jgi:CMP-N-acetylneuraminic acid synthetase
MLPVVQHAVDWLERHGTGVDAVCLLQPTNPLRTAADIEACITLFESEQADTVITVLPVPPEHNPHWVYFRTPEGTLQLSTGERNPIPRRQALPPAFHREGSVYLTRRSVLMEESSFYGTRLLGLAVPPERSVNIDDAEDWARAERLLRHAAANTTQTGATT